MGTKPAFTQGKRVVKHTNTGKFSGGTGGATSEGHAPAPVGRAPIKPKTPARMSAGRNRY